MLNEAVCRKLAKKYKIALDAVRELAAELEKNSGTAARFDIVALGGKGLWQLHRRASAGNGFNEQLNDLVTNLCNDLSQSIRAMVPEEEPTPAGSQARNNLDDTIGLMPVSIKPSIWWPESYGEEADTIGNAGTLRYAYFAACNRLVIRQNLNNRIFDTSGYEVKTVEPGKTPGFFNLMVQTTHGSIPITKLREVPE